MPRTCKHPSCHYPVFSGGYCIRHFGFSPKGRAAWHEIMERKRPILSPYKPRSQKNGVRYDGWEETPPQPKKSAKKGKFYTAVDLADKWFSRYIRLLYSKNGTDDAPKSRVCQCVTSGRWYWVTRITLGHYMSRRYLATRWAVHNCGPQSAKDNKWGAGEPQKFALWLDSHFGKGTADRMRAQAIAGRKFNEFEVRAIAEHFKAEVKKLTEQVGDPWGK